MGAEQSAQHFLPTSDFGDELHAYLLEAPRICHSDLLLTVHFVKGLINNLSGVAGVFTRERIQEADAFLGALASLGPTTPTFPTDVIFRQPPVMRKYEVVWIVEGRGKLGIMEKRLREVCRERESFCFNFTATESVSTQVLDCPQLQQTVQLVAYRDKLLRDFNPYLKEVLTWKRLNNYYIRSILDMGMTGLETGEYVAWLKMEHFSRSLEEEITHRKAKNELFSESEVLNLLHQVVYALLYAQDSVDVSHPGVTPSTILLTQKGTYKVDFGTPWTRPLLQPARSGLAGLGMTLLSAATLTAPSFN